MPRSGKGRRAEIFILDRIDRIYRIFLYPVDPVDPVGHSLSNIAVENRSHR